jgi:hypothetical protein
MCGARRRTEVPTCRGHPHPHPERPRSGVPFVRRSENENGSRVPIYYPLHWMERNRALRR